MKNELKIGIILSYVSMILGYCINLLYTPILLKNVGQNDYGLYNLVVSMVGYLSLLTLGFGSSYMRYYSQFKLNNNDKEIKNLNSIFILIFFTLSIISIIIGELLVYNFEKILGAKLSFGEIYKAKILLQILIINLFFSFLNITFDCYIVAHEKYTYQKTIQLFKIVINPLIVLPLVYIGYGIIGLGIGTTILNILITLINIFYSLKILEMKFSLKKPKFNFFKELFSFSSYIFLYMIIDQLNWNLGRIILGKFKGTSEVAIFSVGAQLNTYVLQFSLVISSVFIPTINRIVAENKYSKELSKIFIKVGKYQYIVVSLLVTGFIFFGKYFIKIWAGKEFETSYYVAVILMTPMTFVIIQNIGIEIRKAQNNHKIPAIVMLIVATINVVLSIPLIKKYGAIGSALATLVTIVLNQIFINIYYQKVVKLEIKLFWLNILDVTKGIVPVIILWYFFKSYFNKCSNIEYLSYIFIYTLFYGLCIFFIGLKREEREALIKKLKKRRKQIDY